MPPADEHGKPEQPARLASHSLSTPPGVPTAQPGAGHVARPRCTPDAGPADAARHDRTGTDHRVRHRRGPRAVRPSPGRRHTGEVVARAVRSDRRLRLYDAFPAERPVCRHHAVLRRGLSRLLRVVARLPLPLPTRARHLYLLSIASRPALNSFPGFHSGNLSAWDTPYPTAQK